MQGELAQGLEQLRQGLALYHPQQHRSLAFVYGQDIGVVCQQWSAWALWFLGYPDQALQMTRDTLHRMAQEVSHPLTLAYVMCLSATVHQFRRETAQAQALAESALRLATEQGFGLWMAAAKIVLGELAEPGDIAVGIAQTREGLAAYRATGAELWLPFHLTQLAEAYGKVGQADAGLAALDEALSIVEEAGSTCGMLISIGSKAISCCCKARLRPLSRRVFTRRLRLPGAGCEGIRVAGSDEPEPSPAHAGQSSRSPHVALGGLRLVYRRV